LRTRLLTRDRGALLIRGRFGSRDLKAGNTAMAIGAIVGAVMRETKGRADGGEVQRLIREKIGA